MSNDGTSLPVHYQDGVAVNEASGAKPNRKPGAPKANKNAMTHGLYSRDAGRIDLRKREDRAVFETLQAIERDLGDLSAQQALILAGIGRQLRDLHRVEAYLAGLKSIVNKRRRSLLPVVIEKHRMLESIRRDLEALGLERVKREPMKLQEYLAAKSVSQAKENAR